MGKAKEHAIGIYMEGIRDGNYLEAMEKHLGARYVQHSTGVPNGKDGFREIFKEFIARNAQRDMQILSVLEDGANVFIFCYQVLNGGAAKWYTMDIFDTDTEGRIVEHWDVIAPVADKTIDDVDVRAGLPAAPTNLTDTAANKRVVKEFVKNVLTVGEHDRLAEFVADDMVEHTPAMKTGRAGLAAGLASGAVGACELLLHVVGEGNMVGTLTKMVRDGVEHCVVDLYKVRGGLIAEHWSVAEAVPPREEWKNSGKF